MSVFCGVICEVFTIYNYLLFNNLFMFLIKLEIFNSVSVL